MSRQLMGGTLIVYDVNQPLKIVHNWGDRNCPSDWTSGDGECTLGRPPGIPINTNERGLPGNEMEALAKQVFSEYVNERLKLIDDPRVGGRPWNVEIYGDWSENLEGIYYEKNPDGSLVFKSNVEYFTHSRNAREGGTFNANPPYTLNRSVASVGLGPAMSTSNFSNESWGGGFVKESFPLVWKSVRDAPLPAFYDGGYSVVPRDRTYYPKDKLFHLIANGFAPYAQVQFVEGQVTPIWTNLGAPGTRFNGFNIQIYKAD
jgi:hypothetical protein